MTTATQNNFEQWCIVELFGHQQIAGRVSEQAIGGCSFIRVDVPPVGDQPAFTKLYGSGAIYAMTPVTEEIALRAASIMRSHPVEVYYLPRPATIQQTADDEHVRDDGDPEI